MKVITVASSKGGATKTTTAANLGFCLGLEGATLIVDLDSQGQLALWFRKSASSNVYDWLTGAKPLEDLVIPAREQGTLWLLLGGQPTKIFEKGYRELSKREFDRLVAMIRFIASKFAYLVLDTAPAGVLQEIAIASADEIVVPFMCEMAGVEGALNTKGMILELNPQVPVTYLPSNCFLNENEYKLSVADVAEGVGAQRLAPLPVPHRVGVTEALAEGKTIFETGSTRLEPVREAFRALAERLMLPSAEKQIPKGVLS